MSDGASLPQPPVVPADAYDEDYYRSHCAGHVEWSASDGLQVAGIYPGVLYHAAFQAGETVVDIGTGRGELPAMAALNGASRAIGIDYSPAAVKLARKTLEVHGVTAVASIEQADARAIPVESGLADLVTMVDVVEHLAPDELAITLAEVHRILAPGGRLFVHTTPNRLVYDVTYRVHRLVMRSIGQRWPSDPRNDYEHEMHVNEQTAGSLRRALRDARFRPVAVSFGRWVHTEFLPSPGHARVYKALARFPLTRPLGAADLMATGWKPDA